MLRPKWKEITDHRYRPNWKIYAWGQIRAVVSLEDDDLWHMSVSHPTRPPTLEEIRAAWYELVPDAGWITGALTFPPGAEYAPNYENCFHICELADDENLAVKRIKKSRRAAP
jgi:hypothetical protein